MSSSSRITVCVRLRPRTQREEQLEDNVVWSVKAGKLVCDQVVHYGDLTTETVTKYSFDMVSAAHTSTEQLYGALLRRRMASLTEGINCTVLAYGQTGSGKTFTTIGEEHSGLAQLCVEDVFMHLRTLECRYIVHMAYFEIYNDQIFDLLSSDSQHEVHSLRVRESPTEGFFVQGLQRVQLRDEHKFQQLLQFGNKQRHTSGTTFNRKSSRSHAIIKLDLTILSADGLQSSAVMHLVDLAGSESKKGMMQQHRTNTHIDAGRESGYINKSLYHLSNVIHKLAQREALARRSGSFGSSSQSPASSPLVHDSPQTPRTVFIPYRDSSLTKVLSQSLGGNAQTVLVACISPCASHLYETILTLNFASLAKRVRNSVQVNMTPSTLLWRGMAKSQSDSRLALYRDAKDAHRKGLDMPKGMSSSSPFGREWSEDDGQDRLAHDSGGGGGGASSDQRHSNASACHDQVLKLQQTIRELNEHIHDLTEQLYHANQLLFYRDSIDISSPQAADDNMAALRRLIDTASTKFNTTNQSQVNSQ